MKTYPLELTGRSFILGVEENWDSYYEVKVEFVHAITVDDRTYYVFADEKKEKVYKLGPRYVGYPIEDVLIGERIVVNLFEGNLEDKSADRRKLHFFATGDLRVHE